MAFVVGISWDIEWESMGYIINILIDMGGVWKFAGYPKMDQNGFLNGEVMIKYMIIHWNWVAIATPWSGSKKQDPATLRVGLLSLALGRLGAITQPPGFWKPWCSWCSGEGSCRNPGRTNSRYPQSVDAGNTLIRPLDQETDGKILFSPLNFRGSSVKIRNLKGAAHSKWLFSNDHLGIRYTSIIIAEALVFTQKQ